MKQYRSISIPEKLPSVNKIKTSRDHSSSRKEQFLQLSLKNPQIFKLHKENLELRSRLKEFNDKLNNLIFESKSKVKKNLETEPSSEMNLDFLRKNLSYYENEHNRITNRQKQLSDPSYEAQLKDEVEKLRQKVAAYEGSVKKSGAKQKLREKVLNTVLDTGETADLHKIFTELNTEISFYTKRYHKLEKLNKQTAQSFKDITEKLHDFEQDLEVLKNQTGDSEDPKKKQQEDHNDKLNRKFGVIAGELESKSKAMNLKLKKLQEELDKNKKVEEELQARIEKSHKEHKKQMSVLNELQSRFTVGHRRIVNDEFMNDDLMFLTEQVS